MSALKALRKLNKKTRQKSSSSGSMPTTSETISGSVENLIGDQKLDNVKKGKEKENLSFRRRAKTFSGVPTKPRLTHSTSNIDDQFTPLEEIQRTLTSPRHFFRRKALIESELQEDVGSSPILKKRSTGTESMEDDESLTVFINVEGYRVSDSIQPVLPHSLYDMIEFLLMKHDVDLKQDLRDYSITATKMNEPVEVNLDDPSTDYTSCYVEIKAPDSSSTKTVCNGEHKEKTIYTVKECLDYFDTHGLCELPLGVHNDSEDEPYHMPRVISLDPIPDSWEGLPIDPQMRSALTTSEVEVQRRIWELLQTEHSYLQILETIINVFMRCLELIRRVHLLVEDTYHNIFGYMEDLYHAHEQLWTNTFEPCLNKTYDTRLPLDLEEIISRFPQSFGGHFDVYEQHCALDSFNITTLNKAKQNPDFNLYLKWCEARPECNRLQLKQLLVSPMQRLTRYSLLLGPIAKKTSSPDSKQELEKIIEEINSFVRVVNNAIRIQEETERVKDVMSRITAYSAVDVPNELRDLTQTYMNLDLLAPMPDVELDKPRLLMVEGSLHYRDNIKPKMNANYVFLFTDMLLVTKQNRKTSNKYTIVRPPVKIISLVVHSLDSESICCLVLNNYNTLNSWFILKAHNQIVAKEWLKQISAAQQFYQDAVEKKSHTWKVVESLRSERILNGIDNLESLNSLSLSQSMWSIHTNRRVGSLYSSTDSLSSRTSLGGDPISTKTASGGDISPKSARLQRMRSNFFSQKGMGSVDSYTFQNGTSLERTTSLGMLGEKPLSYNTVTNNNSSSSSSSSRRPHSLYDSSNSPVTAESGLLRAAQHVPRYMSLLEDMEENELLKHRTRGHLYDTLRTLPRITVPSEMSSNARPLHLSDDSGTDLEGSDTDSLGKFMADGYDQCSLSRSHGRRGGHGMSIFKNKYSDPQSYAKTSSLVDLTDSKSTCLNSSFPEYSHPLSVLSRTPSPTKSKRDVQNLYYRSEGHPETLKEVETPSPSSNETLFQSNEHLVDFPDSTDLLKVVPPHIVRTSPLNHSTRSLRKGRSRSEGSLLEMSQTRGLHPAGSHFDVVYMKEAGGSQKPNVATVKEEEELVPHKEPHAAPKKAFVLRLSDSTSDEVDGPPHNDSNKSLSASSSFNSGKAEVTFSEVTVIHSMSTNTEESEREVELKASSFPMVQNQVVPDLQVDEGQPIGADLELEVSDGGPPDAGSSIDLRDIEVQLVVTDLSEPDPITCGSSCPDSTSLQSPPDDCSTVDPCLDQNHENGEALSVKGDMGEPQEEKINSSSKDRSDRTSLRSVRELSKMFEVPMKTLLHPLTPANHMTTAVPTPPTTTSKVPKGKPATPDNLSKQVTTTNFRRGSPCLRRRKESSKIPTPSSSPHVSDRRKSLSSKNSISTGAESGGKVKSLSVSALGKQPGETSSSAPGKQPGETSSSAPGNQPGETSSSAPGKQPGETTSSLPGKQPGETSSSAPGGNQPVNTRAVSPSSQPASTRAVSPSTSTRAVSPSTSTRAVSPSTSTRAVSPSTSTRAVSPSRQPASTRAVSPSRQPASTRAVSPSRQTATTRAVSPNRQTASTRAVSPSRQPASTRAVSPSRQSASTRAVSPSIQSAVSPSRQSRTGTAPNKPPVSKSPGTRTVSSSSTQPDTPNKPSAPVAKQVKPLTHDSTGSTPPHSPGKQQEKLFRNSTNRIPVKPKPKPRQTASSPHSSSKQATQQERTHISAKSKFRTATSHVPDKQQERPFTTGSNHTTLKPKPRTAQQEKLISSSPNHTTLKPKPRIADKQQEKLFSTSPNHTPVKPKPRIADKQQEKLFSTSPNHTPVKPKSRASTSSHAPSKELKQTLLYLSENMGTAIEKSKSTSTMEVDRNPRGMRSKYAVPKLVPVRRDMLMRVKPKQNGISSCREVATIPVPIEALRANSNCSNNMDYCSNILEISVGPGSNSMDSRSNSVDPCSNSMDSRSNSVDPWSDSVDPWRNSVDFCSNSVDPCSNSVDPWSNSVDSHSNSVDPRSNSVDPRSNSVGPGSNSVDPWSNSVDFWSPDVFSIPGSSNSMDLCSNDVDPWSNILELTTNSKDSLSNNSNSVDPLSNSHSNSVTSDVFSPGSSNSVNTHSNIFNFPSNNVDPFSNNADPHSSNNSSSSSVGRSNSSGRNTVPPAIFPTLPLSSCTHSSNQESICDEGKSSICDASPSTRTIFRPRREFSCREFAECTAQAHSFGMHSKLKQHHSFNDLHDSTSSTKKARLSSPHFKSPREWLHFGSSLPKKVLDKSMEQLSKIHLRQ